MYSTHMGITMRSLGKAPSTLLTGVWFLSSVRTDMINQMLINISGVRTVWALVLFVFADFSSSISKLWLQNVSYACVYYNVKIGKSVDHIFLQEYGLSPV